MRRLSRKRKKLLKLLMARAWGYNAPRLFWGKSRTYFNNRLIVTRMRREFEKDEGPPVLGTLTKSDLNKEWLKQTGRWRGHLRFRPVRKRKGAPSGTPSAPADPSGK